MTDASANGDSLPAPSLESAESCPRDELVRTLQQRLPESEQEAFGRCALLLNRIVGAQAHDRVDEIRRRFRPYSPEHCISNLQRTADKKSKNGKKRGKSSKGRSGLFSRRAKRIGTAIQQLNDVPSSNDPGLVALRDGLQGLVFEAGFRPVTEEELAFAIEENQAFEVELEVDWEQFEDKPLIAVRGRSIETMEGRFIQRKLPGYLVRGTLGVMIVGALLLGVHFLLDILLNRHGGLTQVVAGPTVEKAATFGPGHRDEFHLDPPIAGEGQSVKWELLTEDENGDPVPLPSDGSRGVALAGSKPDKIGYQAPAEVPKRGFDLVARWSLMADGVAEPLRTRDALYRVESEVTVPPISSPLRSLSTILLWLGAIGFGVGLANLLRPWLIAKLSKASSDKPADSRPDGTRMIRREKRESRLQVSKFKDLFRKEVFEAETFKEVLLACKTQDLPYYRLHLYRDVPLAELETVLPNTKPRVKLMDGLMFVVQFATGALLVLFRVAIILAATVFSFGLGALLAILNAGGMASRSWGRFRTNLKLLSSAVEQILHRRTIGTSFAVVHALADAARETGWRETIVALAHYQSLTYATSRAEARNALRREVQIGLREAGLEMTSFDPERAMSALARLGLLESESSAHFHVTSPSAAVARLESKWTSLILPAH